MLRFTRFLPASLIMLPAMILSLNANAQEANGFYAEVELGAVLTSGNTENENVRYGVDLDWIDDEWMYKFTSDGFRSSKENELTAQRLYHVALTEYSINEYSFVEARLAYEDDRFSGFDSQTDFSLSYGRNLLLDIDNMDLALTVGAGLRQSKTEDDSLRETLIRFGFDYDWELTESTTFRQLLSTEIGEDNTISRSETAIETFLMANLSMKVSLKVKNQSEVPVNREKTDTETSITLLWRY